MFSYIVTFLTRLAVMGMGYKFSKISFIIATIIGVGVREVVTIIIYYKSQPNASQEAWEHIVNWFINYSSSLKNYDLITRRV